MNFGYGGIGGIVVLLLDVWAIVNIAQSSITPGKKALWIVLVLVFPLLGFLIWAIAGPRAPKTL